MDVANCFLDGNADVVEFCPHQSFQHLLAASTYTLQEGDCPSRSGSISLFDLDADLGKLELVHRVETAGIFDMKWNPVGDNVNPFLAQADADGHLRILHLQTTGTEAGGELMKEVNDEKISSSMCLCLDWNPSATSISVGLSDGSISIVSFLESRLVIIEEWKAHEYEVWATCFDPHQPNLVYSGSDDCKFSGWDLRNPAKLAFQNTRVHKMGVCCVSKSSSDPYKLLTGSYDEYLRIWDVRSISKPVNETSICLGGVWRIKQHPFVPGIVLAACMHNGFAVVKNKGDGAEVIETYSKHESLAYGADWQRGNPTHDGKTKSTAVATCSFYDRCLIGYGYLRVILLSESALRHLTFHWCSMVVQYVVNFDSSYRQNLVVVCADQKFLSIHKICFVLNALQSDSNKFCRQTFTQISSKSIV